MDKRTFLKTTAIISAGVWLNPTEILANDSKNQLFTLPKLNYEYGDLTPHIDKMTMEIHHSKHHQAYITKLNEALTNSPLQKDSLEQILQKITEKETAIRNNGGGHYNHTLFWELLTPNKDKNKLSDTMTKALEKYFGGYDKFKEAFKKEALGRFGSGWTWLLFHKHKGLQIMSTPNQDNILMKHIYKDYEGFTPILCLDVWEHAYYLNYQNKRADYIDAFWNIVNWQEVEKRMNG